MVNVVAADVHDFRRTRCGSDNRDSGRHPFRRIVFGDPDLIARTGNFCRAITVAVGDCFVDARNLYRVGIVFEVIKVFLQAELFGVARERPAFIDE